MCESPKKVFVCLILTWLSAAMPLVFSTHTLVKELFLCLFRHDGLRPETGKHLFAIERAIIVALIDANQCASKPLT
jgi:hypothetical protein